MAGLDINTKLLINSDRADGSLEVADFARRHVVTQNGTTALRANCKPSPLTDSEGSAYFDGRSSGSTNGLYAVDHADWDIFSVANATVDFWVKMIDTGGTQYFISQREDATNYWYVLIASGALYFGLASTAAIGNVGTGAVGNISDSEWHHITACKVGNDYGLYLDGVQIGYFTTALTDTLAGNLNIGNWDVVGGGASAMRSGYLDEVHLTNANDFTAAPVVGLTDTITVPTSQYADGGTAKLLLHFDGFIIDTGATVHTITNNGGVVYGTTVLGGTAAPWFDGSSGFLSAPDSSDFDVVADTSDFTLDCWVKPEVVAGAIFHMFHQSDAVYDANNRWYFSYFDNGAGIAGFFITLIVGGVGQFANVAYCAPLLDTKWHHVALCKVSTTYGIYVDGVQVGTFTDASTDTFTGPLTIGATPVPGGLMDGYLDDARITKANLFSATPATTTFTGDTHTNTTIDSIADTSSLRVGMNIAGADLVANATTIVSIDSGTAITVSNAATGSTVGVTFTVPDTDTITVPTRQPVPDADTKLLVKGDALDQSANNGGSNLPAHISAYTGAVTTQAPFGSLYPPMGQCGIFDGSTDYVSAPDHADWNWGTGDFTLQTWIYYSDLPVNPLTMDLLTQYVSGNDFKQWTVLNSGGDLYMRFQAADSGSLRVNVSSSTTLSLSVGQWYHMALTRNGNNFRFFVDGIQQGDTLVSAGTVADIGGALEIGRLGSGVGYVDGRMAHFEVIKGAAKWVNNFSPPRTPPLAEDSNTKLLLHFNGDLIDSSPSGHTITDGGTMTYEPFYYGLQYVGIFDGSTDYLDSPDNAAWDIVGAQKLFTVDFWMKYDDPASIANSKWIIQQWEDANNRWEILVTAAGYVGMNYWSGGVGVSVYNATATPIMDGNWHHYAFVRSTNDWGLYVDGVQTAYLSDSTTDTYGAPGLLTIGRYATGTATSYIQGMLKEMHMTHTNFFGATPVVGLTDTITVPTEPYKLQADDKLLLHFNNNLTDSSPTPKTITDRGTMTYQLVDQKYGGGLPIRGIYNGALYFNGSADYITLPDNTGWDIVAVAATNWTIDLWVKHFDHVGVEQYIAQYDVANERWQLFHNNSTGLGFSLIEGGAATFTMPQAAEITDNEWHHLCLVKSGNNYGLYKDGQLMSYINDSNTSIIPGTLYIGQSGGASNYFHGFLDAIRIRKSNYFGATPASTTITGDTNTSTTIDGVSAADMLKVRVGMYVTGTDVPVNTFITQISGTEITISNAATGTTGAVTLTIPTTDTIVLPTRGYGAGGGSLQSIIF